MRYFKVIQFECGSQVFGTGPTSSLIFYHYITALKELGIQSKRTIVQKSIYAVSNHLLFFVMIP